jgi:hypothetical protein
MVSSKSGSGLTLRKGKGETAMTDIVLDVELMNEDEDMRLSAAIDSFVSLQESSAQAGGFDLDLMVRTVFGPGGERLKQIIFQQHDLAEAFHNFWNAFR